MLCFKRQLGHKFNFNLAMKAPSSSGFLRYLEYTLVLYSAALPGSLSLVWSIRPGRDGKEDVGNEHVH